MPSVETIYQESIRPLPVSDQMRLAEIIMERASRPGQNPNHRSALEIIESARITTPTRSAAEIDEYLRMERDSWEN